jgi:two-component system CheB/CheR fusion protein
MFDRFRQADTSSTRNHVGLGLGFSLVRYSSKAHGGSVTAHSDGIGRGTTIALRLPCRNGLSSSAA